MAAATAAVTVPRTVFKAATDWTSLNSLTIEFEKLSEDTKDIHVSMNQSFCSPIYGFDRLFTDASKKELVADAMDHLYDLIVEHATDLATETKKPARIAGIVKKTWMLRYPHSSKQKRSLAKFGGHNTALGVFFNRQVKDGEPDPTIFVNFRSMHLHPTHHITFLNFDDFSDRPFVNATPLTRMSTTPFHPGSLPPTVRVRFDCHLDPGFHLRSSDLQPFTALGMDTKFYQDAVAHNTFILLNGQAFTVTALNEKELLRNPPLCVDTSPPGFRMWYRLVTDHAFTHGYYLHPYFLFQKNVGGSRGFTCGASSDDDLPDTLASYIETCNLGVWKLLSFKGMFPEGSIYGTFVRQAYGHGYEAVNLMMMHNHPAYKEHPSLVVKNAPVQTRGKSLTEYYNVFRDHLDMKAFISDADVSLDTPHMIDDFIDGTLDSAYFVRVSREDRVSQPHKFMAATIVATLEQYRGYADYKPLDPSPLPISLAPKDSWRTPSRAAKIHHVDSATGPSTPDTSLESTPPSNPSSFSFDDANYGLASLLVPDDADLMLDHRYRAAVYQLAARPSDSSSPCLICGGAHKFDDCTVLNNTPYLKDHYIQFSSFLKRDMRNRMAKTGSLPPTLDAGANALDTADISRLGVDNPSPPSARDFHWRQE